RPAGPGEGATARRLDPDRDRGLQRADGARGLRRGLLDADLGDRPRLRPAARPSRPGAAARPGPPAAPRRHPGAPAHPRLPRRRVRARRRPRGAAGAYRPRGQPRHLPRRARVAPRPGPPPGGRLLHRLPGRRPADGRRAGRAARPRGHRVPLHRRHPRLHRVLRPHQLLRRRRRLRATGGDHRGPRRGPRGPPRHSAHLRLGVLPRYHHPRDRRRMMTSTWALPGLRLSDHTLAVPLDHADPRGAQIDLFARVITAEGGEHRPYLVFLQGGPGSEPPRPVDASSPGCLARALRQHRVVMLDQRGTGRSTPVGPDTALPEGAIPGAATLREATAAQQAEYLTHFRADAIVADAELLREHLGVASWLLLGQSFGGFTTLRYLSAAAGSVDTALFTGGLPTVGPGMDEVYATTWQGMIGRSERHWARFPADRDRFRRLSDAADAGRLRLPDGQRVGVERLRRLGPLLGASQGAERLHHLLDLDPAAPA